MSVSKKQLKALSETFWQSLRLPFYSSTESPETATLRCYDCAVRHQQLVAPEVALEGGWRPQPLHRDDTAYCTGCTTPLKVALTEAGNDRLLDIYSNITDYRSMERNPLIAYELSVLGDSQTLTQAQHQQFQQLLNQIDDKDTL